MRKVISWQDVVRKFRNLGYQGPFSGGKHLFMIKEKQKVRIPNPHKSKDIHIGLVREIIRQAEIEKDQWEKE
jgi:predicted RNA binding protein YcfA (HicA-like mRNA interferase family)